MVIMYIILLRRQYGSTINAKANNQFTVISMEARLLHTVTEGHQLLMINTGHHQFLVIKDRQFLTINTEDHQLLMINIGHHQFLVINTEDHQFLTINTEDRQVQDIIRHPILDLHTLIVGLHQSQVIIPDHPRVPSHQYLDTLPVVVQCHMHHQLVQDQPLLILVGATENHLLLNDDEVAPENQAWNRWFVDDKLGKKEK